MTSHVDGAAAPPGRWGQVGFAVVWWLWAGLWLAIGLGGLLQGDWGAGGLCLLHAATMVPPIMVMAQDRGLRRLRLVLAWLSAMGFLVLVGLGVGGAVPVAAPTPAPAAPVSLAATSDLTLAQYRAKIPDHAVIEIDRSFYPKLYAALGPVRVADANRLAPWVGLRVALSPRCDQVDLVEMAADATPTQLRWFVDCANKQRFYVDEAEAKATRAKFAGLGAADLVVLAPTDFPRSENQKVALFDEALAVGRCEGAMKALLQASGSYQPAGPSKTILHPQRGRATIVRSFTAKNAFNARLDSQWDCLLDAGDMSIIELKYLDGGQWRVVSR